MINFLKTIVILGLLTAVVISGLKIYIASSKFNNQVTADTSQLKKTIEKAKKLTIKAKQTTEAAVKKILKSSIKNRKTSFKIGKTKQNNIKSANLKDKKSGPVDAEDAQLTSEVLHPLPHEVKSTFKADSQSQERINKPIAKQLFDLNRTSRIEAIYMSTSKILDLD